MLQALKHRTEEEAAMGSFPGVQGIQAEGGGQGKGGGREGLRWGQLGLYLALPMAKHPGPSSHQILSC